MSYIDEIIMKILVFIAKIIDKTISILSTLFVIILLLYSGFSIWYTHMVMNNSFVDDKIWEYKPTPSIEEPINLDKEEVNPNKENENKSPSSNDMLIEINKDYKSWITIFDTHIDYPVVQGKNNMEYINKNFYGEYSISGIPFLDYRNSEYFQDNYNLLYGHHMQNDAMFSDVINFLNEDYFNNHLMGELYSLDNEYDIYLFASFETYASDEFVFMPGNLTKSQMQALLDYIKSQSVVYKEVGVNTESKLICLSTCSNYSSNKRAVLFGMLVKR